MSDRMPKDDSGADIDGVRGVRTARPPHAELFDPRDPAWDELVAAYRRYLLARAAQSETHAAEDPAHHRGLPTSMPPGLQEALSGAAYRYSKGPDFTNDSLGYGEALRERLWWVVEGGVVAQDRTSQRTKSGKQLLNAQRLDARQAAAQEAALSPTAHRARTLPAQASQPRRRAP